MDKTGEVIRTADVVALAEIDGVDHVLLIERRWPPFAEHLALPGGHVDEGESDRAAAARELAEETGIHVAPDDLVLIGVYDAPGRDPRGRYATTAFGVRVPTATVPVAASDAAKAGWVPVPAAMAGPMAFDHRSIVSDALPTLAN